MTSMERMVIETALVTLYDKMDECGPKTFLEDMGVDDVDTFISTFTQLRIEFGAVV